MKRLSAAFDQVLLGNTAYCRRPPRPKPNENPSPYVVRLSLCYGIGSTHPFANAVCLRVGSPFFSHKVNVEASKSLCENSTYSASFVRQASLIRKTCTQVLWVRSLKSAVFGGGYFIIAKPLQGVLLCLAAIVSSRLNQPAVAHRRLAKYCFTSLYVY